MQFAVALHKLGAHLVKDLNIVTAARHVAIQHLDMAAAHMKMPYAVQMANVFVKDQLVD